MRVAYDALTRLPNRSLVSTARGARALARKLAMQALYQWQMTAQPPPRSGAVSGERRLRPASTRIISPNWSREVIARNEEIIDALKPYIDRPLDSSTRWRRAILMIGMYELKQRLDIPYRVVINEAVDCASASAPPKLTSTSTRCSIGRAIFALPSGSKTRTVPQRGQAMAA